MSKLPYGVRAGPPSGLALPSSRAHVQARAMSAMHTTSLVRWLNGKPTWLGNRQHIVLCTHAQKG